MTAVDDFVAEHPGDLRMVVLPAYFGLAILADHRTLDARPELAAFLDHLESPAGKDEVADLAESIRISGAIFEQNVTAHHQRVIGRGARRYLDLLKSELAGQLQVADRARITHLAEGAHDPAALRDPRTALPKVVDRLARRAEAGLDTDPDAGPATGLLAPGGRARLDQLEERLDQVREAGVPGALVDVGVGPGGTSILMRAWLEAHELPDREVWVVDPFRVDGPDDGDLNTDPRGLRPSRPARRLGALRQRPVRHRGLVRRGRAGRAGPDRAGAHGRRGRRRAGHAPPADGPRRPDRHRRPRRQRDGHAHRRRHRRRRCR